MNRIALGNRTFDKRDQLGNDRQIIAIDSDQQATGIGGRKAAGIYGAGTISDRPSRVSGPVVMLDDNV